MRYTFDRFELDSGLHRLRGPDGHDVALRPQAFKVLEYLVSRAPSVVSRDELLKGVWGHNALSVSGVSQAIREIRRALCDDASQPRIIATRHGCGYQVVTRVVEINPSDDASAQIEAVRRPAPGPLGTIVVFCLLLIGLVAGAYWFGSGPHAVVPFDDSLRSAPMNLAGVSVPVGGQARVESANSQGQDSMYAYAELALGRALARVDRLTASREAFVRAARSMRSSFSEAENAAALLELARLDLRQNRLDDIRMHLEPACAIYSSIGSTPGMANCTRIEGDLLAVIGDTGDAESMLAQSVMNFEQSGHILEAGDTHLALANLKLETGDLEGAETSLIRAGHLLERVGDRAGYARVRLFRGTLWQRRGNPAEALVAFRDAYTIFQSIDDRAGVAAVASAMATSFLQAGNHARAAEKFDEAISLYRLEDASGALAHALFNAGRHAQRSGRLTAAESYLGEAAALHAASGNEGQAVLAFSELARIHIDQARTGSARDTLARAAGLRTAGAGPLAILDSVSGYLALLECDRDAAEQYFARARKLRMSLNDEFEFLRSHLDQARLFIERGDPAGAEASVRHILERVDEKDRNSVTAEAFIVLVDALDLQGRTEEARRELGRMERAGLVDESEKVQLAYQILLGKLNIVADPALHLRQVRDRANAAGYRLLAMETDVALASKLFGRGLTGEGREIAAAVMESAKRSGMLFVAERAMRLGSATSDKGFSLSE